MIIGVVGLVGVLLDAKLADLRGRSRGTTLTSVAFIPVLVLAEAVLRLARPSPTCRPSTSPRLRPPPIDAPAPAPFNWGLAHPLRGVVTGSGVGAARRSAFSTGEALEPVTTWRPGAELALTVLSEPPAMRELSLTSM